MQTLIFHQTAVFVITEFSERWSLITALIDSILWQNITGPKDWHPKHNRPKMRSFAKFLHPMMENKAFRNISSSEFRQGVYAVPLTRISAQGIRDGGPVDERDDKRVVGKGWRLVDGTKIEVLLFEDGTWGNSEEYARVPKKKSQRVSRPPSMTSPQGRNRTTSVAFAASPFTPYVTGTNSRPAANSDEQVAKADVCTGQLAEAEKTITVCDSLKADLDSLA